MSSGSGLDYRPGDGWIHRLHPVARGGAALSVILAFSLHRHGLPVSGAGCATLLLAAASGGLPVAAGLGAVRRLWVLIVAVALAQVWRGGDAPLVLAVDAVLRLVGVFLASGWFVMTTTQAELLVFWEACFRPLGWVGLSTREPALVLTVALRFLPVILAETERIRLAQQVRGAGFAGGGGWLEGPRRLLPLLIPTLVLSLDKANILALAMEARGYRLHGTRTKYKLYQWRWSDLAVLATTAGACLAGLLA